MKGQWVISHLLALSLGFLLFHHEAAENNDPPEVTESQRQPTDPVLPSSENPILHADSDDYRRAFQLMLEGRDSAIPLEWFLVDWVQIDPEAALLAFSRYFLRESDPDGPGWYLRIVQGKTGAKLAHALVEHYRELHFMEPKKVLQALGDSLGALASEDLDEALALFSTLPKGVQSESMVLRNLLDPLPKDTLDELFENVRGKPDEALATVPGFWERAVYRAWRVYPPDEFGRLFLKVDAPEALPFFTRNLLNEFWRFDKPGRFLKPFQALPRSRQEAVVRHLQASRYGQEFLESEYFKQKATDLDVPGLVDLLNHSDPE